MGGDCDVHSCLLVYIFSASSTFYITGIDKDKEDLFNIEYSSIQDMPGRAFSSINMCKITIYYSACNIKSEKANLYISQNYES